MTESIRVASVRYAPEAQLSFQGYAQKIQRIVELAVQDRADLILFPEYASLELSSIGGRGKMLLKDELEVLQIYHSEFKQCFSELARRYGLYIVAPSFPVRENSIFLNRAYLFAPSGEVAFQDKLNMTRFEKEQWGVSSGKAVKVFDTSLGKIGIVICYDSEFPALVRQMANSGAELILIPSCTDTLAGYNRVRLAARARAMENQCYTVLAALHGECGWSQAIDENIGATGIYGPVDSKATHDGIIAEQKLTEKGELVTASLDLALASSIRSDGDVFLFKDSSCLSLPKVSYQGL